MRDSLSLRYDGGDIPNFLSRADKVYNRAKFGNNMKFELLQDSLKPGQMSFQFVLFRGSKTYEDVRKDCREYAENITMMEGQTTPIFQQARKMDKKEREDKINELCKKVENLQLMMTKQIKQRPKQVEPACYNCGKKGH